MSRAAPGRDSGIEIDLIDQYASVRLSRDLGQRAELRLVGERAARIVKICDHDQARSVAQSRGDAIDVDPEGVLRATLEALDVGAEEARGPQQRLVSRALDQHL